MGGWGGGKGGIKIIIGGELGIKYVIIETESMSRFHAFRILIIGFLSADFPI
jgi:hypothetical protein